MFIDIITNFTIIFTFTILIYWVFSSILKTKTSRPKFLTWLIGLCFGMLGVGITGLFLAVQNNVLVNTRFITFLFGGMLGGPIAMLVSGLILFVSRLIIGLSSTLSLIFAIHSFICSVVLSIICIYKPISFKNIHIYFSWMLAELTLAMLILYPLELTTIVALLIFVCYSIALFLLLTLFLKKQQELTNSAKKTATLTKIDFLTQLPNNYALERKLQRFIDEHIPFEVIHIDIDLFKNWNMKYSYQSGDKLLSQIAHTIRVFADRHDAFASRIGGDEFYCILANSNPAQSIITAHHLSQLIANTPYTINNEEVHITVSASITSYPENGQTLSAIYAASNSTLKIITDSKTNVLMHYNQLKQSQKYF